MLLSRFWYVIVALTLGATISGLFLAASIYNRASRHSMDQALAADTQVVGWYLNDDARRRSSLLLNVCLDDGMRNQLAKSSAKPDAIPKDVGAEVRSALRKQAEAVPEDSRFSALFAVDQHGRVVGQVGFDQASGINNFELGGYPVVADALHGWVRDDAWVLDGRIYLVVARPVEIDTNQMPAGAVVGLRLIDNDYVRLLSKRTGAAVGFYAAGAVRAKAAPEGFDATQLDTIVSDINNLGTDKEYAEKGRSKPRILMGDVGVIYSRVPGEAWDLNTGYVVGRAASVVPSPFAFTQHADDADKKSVPWLAITFIFILTAGLGILFTVLEHTRPLHTLRVEAQRMAKGDVDMLQLSKFRGVFRKIASDLNDGTDKVAAKGGAPRKAADLESVLGPIPAQPNMSAFAFPLEGQQSGGAEPQPPIPGLSGASSPKGPQPPAPRSLNTPSGLGVSLPTPPSMPASVVTSAPVIPSAPVAAPVPASAATNNSLPTPLVPPPVSKAPAAGPMSARGPAIPGIPRAQDSTPSIKDSDEDETVISAVPQEILQASATGSHRAVKEADEISEWHQVFEEFLRTKRQCGEPTAGLTFEKFQQTLRKNRDQLVTKTNCKRVKFTVYVKDGRAALKASPAKP